MTFGDRRFTKIKGLSDRRLLPRIGIIRLGIKAISKGGKEYPKEVSYFVCPPEVEKVYGERPTKLDIMLPLEDEGSIFPQSYKWYVFDGLRCKGNGETALRRLGDLVVQRDGKVLDDAGPRLLDSKPEADPNALVEIGCPCPLLETGDCRQNANLMVLLPKVSMGGVYQIRTGSFHNIVRVNSAIDYLRALIGRIALVPLVLSRQEEEIQYEGKKAKHYLLQLTLNADIHEVIKLRENARLVLTQVERLAIPAPVEEGPEPTGPAPVEEETEAAPATALPPQQQAPEEETPVQYWKRNILSTKTLADLKALWDNFARKGGRYSDFTATEQQDLMAVKEKRKAELGAGK
jgi:hypothetical protein